MGLKKLLFFFAVFLLGSSANAIDDYPGSKDHPVLSRFPGSIIFHYDEKKFDEYHLITGPVKSGSKLKDIKYIKVEGKVTKISYDCPKDRSTFEIFKNYEMAIKKAGFEILYQGRGDEIRGIYNILEEVNHDFLGGWDDPDIRPWFYISAVSSDKKIYISLFVLGGGYWPEFGARAILSVIEPGEMETGLITASQIASEIKAKGHIAIYGIYFDFDKADIKPESEPTIKEIAKFLKENPDIKVYIVGHTDSIGKLDYNLDLSKRRAEAVLKELLEKHKIKKERLKAFGVGPLCPVATNDTEEGRAKNRRVEIVKE